MARKNKPFVSVTGKSGPSGRILPTTFGRGIDRLMSIQRPAVLAHLRSMSRRHPDASSTDLIKMLERRYLATITTSGAAVGATAVIPAFGTVTTLALSGVETAAFLEATALFGQSVSEVHGLPVTDPERARSLVMALMLGREGSDLVRQWGAETLERDITRNMYWGEVVTTSMPRMVVGPLADKLKVSFIRRFAARGSGSIIGKAMPFGIGAVIGGAGNHIIGKRVLHSSRVAFGAAPLTVTSLEAVASAEVASSQE